MLNIFLNGPVLSRTAFNVKLLYIGLDFDNNLKKCSDSPVVSEEERDPRSGHLNSFERAVNGYDAYKVSCSHHFWQLPWEGNSEQKYRSAFQKNFLPIFFKITFIFFLPAKVASDSLINLMEVGLKASSPERSLGEDEEMSMFAARSKNNQKKKKPAHKVRRNFSVFGLAFLVEYSLPNSIILHSHKIIAVVVWANKREVLVRR